MVGTDTTPMRLTRKDFDNPEVLNARNPHPHWGFTHGKSIILHDACFEENPDNFLTSIRSHVRPQRCVEDTC